ncbi:MAG: PleD family two-component system response regulator [Endomicrobiia bacterium]
MAKKILIVEDDRQVANLLSHTLSKIGYDMTISYNGNEALGVLKDTLFDLIILDVMLPDISGWELLTTIKQKTNFKNIPVLMCTEKNLVKDVEQALTLGAVGYIIKPFELERVVKKVVDIVGLD